MKKHYIIYQITNNINGKIYIGKHETFNIDDDYFGSGTYLIRAQKKYGLENFTKTILFECANQYEMDLLEQSVVTKEFCQRSDTYNIQVGGKGGDWVSSLSQTEYDAWIEKCKKSQHREGEELKKFQQKVSDGVRTFRLNHPRCMAGDKNPRYGKKNSQKMRKILSDKMKTQSNNMLGSHWYVNYNTRQNIIVRPGDIIPNGFVRGKCSDFDKYFQKKEFELRRKNDKEMKSLLRQTKKQQTLKNKQNILKEKMLLLSQMREWYLMYGWESMVQKFNYKHSIQAFSQQYIKYFDESISGRKIQK